MPHRTYAFLVEGIELSDIYTSNSRPTGFVEAKSNVEYIIPNSELYLGEVIGEGSFGKVYRGFWNGGDCAIKRCTVDTLEAIQIEANVLRSVQPFPNILQFYG